MESSWKEIRGWSFSRFPGGGGTRMYRVFHRGSATGGGRLKSCPPPFGGGQPGGTALTGGGFREGTAHTGGGHKFAQNFDRFFGARVARENFSTLFCQKLCFYVQFLHNFGKLLEILGKNLEFSRKFWIDRGGIPPPKNRKSRGGTRGGDKNFSKFRGGQRLQGKENPGDID